MFWIKLYRWNNNYIEWTKKHVCRVSIEKKMSEIKTYSKYKNTKIDTSYIILFDLSIGSGKKKKKYETSFFM